MARWTLLGLCAALLLSGCGLSDEQIRKRGMSEFQLGRHVQAGEYFRQLLARRPSDPDALYFTGRILHADGAYEQAAYYYECAIDADPGYNDARIWLARIRQPKR